MWVTNPVTLQYDIFMPFYTEICILYYFDSNEGPLYTLLFRQQRRTSKYLFRYQQFGDDVNIAKQDNGQYAVGMPFYTYVQARSNYLNYIEPCNLGSSVMVKICPVESVLTVQL